MGDLADFAEQLRNAARSELSLDRILAEEPVPLSVFVQDKEYLANPQLSPKQYEAVRHIERIYYDDMYPQLAAHFESPRPAGTLHVGQYTTWRTERYWSASLPMKNLITLQWGKGCKVGAAPVYDARTGQWTPISQWTGGHVAGANDDGEIGVHAASEAWISGRGECFRVTTTSGLVDEVYAGHRYLARGKIDQRGGRRTRKYYSAWKELRDLKVGDYIAAANTVPEPLECVTLDDDVVELIALLLGDGCLPNTSKKRYSVALTVSKDDTAVTRRYTQIVEALGGTVVSRANGHRVNLYAVGTRIRGGNPIITLLREYGLDGQEARNKCVPQAIFSLSNKQIALFLSRLIDTDGHIYTSSKGLVPEIGYTTASKQLATDVQRLLLRLGCQAQIQHKRITYKGEVRTYFCVRMRDRTNVLNFCEQISTLSKEEARLRAVAACSEGNGKTHARYGDLFWDKIVSIEPIGEQDYWDLEVPGVQNYVSNGTLNHNSGKDHICRVASMRIAYLLMCLRSPQEYYGLPDQDTIHLLNVASNSQQAQQAFFMPILRAVKKGWFKDKCLPKQNVISYAKNIESISGHSDAESQEGLNLLVGIADEIDAFKSKKEMVARRGTSAREPTKSAEGILTMMRSSSATRFPEVYKQVRISYPRYLGSMIQQLTDEGKKDLEKYGESSRHYVSGPFATWEVNPRVKGREVFAADYRDDPIMARSKYECQPARAINPYFRNVAAVDSCFAAHAQAPLTITYRLDEDGHRPSWSPVFTFAPDLIPIRGAIYSMHADLAVTGDRAGIAMAHVVKFDEFEGVAEDAEGRISTIREMRPTVKVDFCASFTADSAVDPPREIQIRWARMLCFELIRRGFNIRRFTFDAFESRDSMQILESKGIKTMRVSTDTSEEPWRNLRDLLYEGRVVIPAPHGFNDVDRPAEFLLRDELFGLTRLTNGKIDHPVDGSKDEADAASCAVFGAVELGGQEENDQARAYLSDIDFAVGSLFDMPEAPAGFNLRAALAPVDLSSPW